ncbi:hypothetical protein QR680_010934 [Steinernema hermaphroditum]|uniref:Btz domain-containing protein n=1 Tax=Steinernema hermaphroditum TaxID=289476 RepID=A0AA39MCC9_9BILA|nr:hypothetical protein QR680_010934 [Steinernema hermaphroditum]
MSYRPRDDRRFGYEQRRGDFRSSDFHRRPPPSRDFRDRDFDSRPRQRVGPSQTVNELDRDSIVGASGGSKRGQFQRGGRISFDRPPQRGRDFRSFRQEPYGGRPFRGGRDHRTEFRPREEEYVRERQEESDRPKMNIFDPAVVPKKGFYFEHDNRGGDFVKRDRDHPRRGNGDRYRDDRDRIRNMYDPRRDGRDFDRNRSHNQRPAPDGWRNDKQRDERHPNEREQVGRTGRFDRSRLSGFSRADSGKWAHDMYEEAEKEGGQNGGDDGAVADE